MIAERMEYRYGTDPLDGTVAPEIDRGPIIGRAYPCGCRTDRLASRNTRCPTGWRLWQAKEACAPGSPERWRCLRACAEHLSSDGQQVALTQMARSDR